MSIFIKQFDTGVNANFASLAIKDGTNNYLVGTADTAALTVTIDPDGHVIDQVEYTMEESRLSLLQALPITDHGTSGEFILFGARYVDSTHSIPMLIRVYADGSVNWAKTYGDSNTKMPLEIIPSFDSVGEERYTSYIFISKCYSGTDEDVQIVRVDRNGSVEYNTALGFISTSIQTARLIQYGSGGALVYGGTKLVSGYDSFVATVDKTLVYLSKEIFKTTVYHEIRSIIPSATSGKYIVCGDVGAVSSSKSIFAFEMTLSTTSVASTAYGYLAGTANSHLRMLSFGGYYFLVAYKPGVGSTVVKYSTSLSVLGVYDFALDDVNYLSDLIGDTSNSELILSGWTDDGSLTHPLVVRTDKDITTCLTEENGGRSARYTFTSTSSFKIGKASHTPTVRDLDLDVNHYPIPAHYLCPEPDTVPLDGSLFQSPYLYMQAAGSDNSDGSSEGIHLRWRFNKSLGDNHFAKGAYANVGSPYYTTIGFNQPDDYVKIYKTPYGTPYQAKVTINNTLIPTEVTTGTKREWHYNGITLTNGGVGTTNIIIRFSNTSQYDTLRATMGTLQPQDLMKQYTGIILVGAENKNTFSAKFNVLYNPGSAGSAYMRIEGIAYNDPADTTSTFITGRKTFTGPTALAGAGIIGETMAGVRLDFFIAYPSEIILETYEDYITTITTNGLWEFKGDYALTLDTNIAYDRLENNTNPYAPATDKYAVDNAWNKYNDSSAVTGEFKVRVANYQHRWNPVPDTEHPDTDPADGFQAGVQNYLQYSITDTKATAYLPVEDDPDNDAMIQVSYFDLLRLATIDYHLARMFGLGMIDADIPDPSSPYVYLMVYTSHGALETGDPSGRVQTHLYMTLPTTEQDYRLPTTPVQDPVTYGISVDNGIGVMNQLTDDDGYVPYDNVRYVDLNREVYNYEKPYGAFYYDPAEFILANETIPVMYGVDYKASGESVYRKPEITRDQEYYDRAGYNEVLEIPEMGDTQVYIHQEREEGVHCYALYSINWFSRISPLSNEQCTDYTLFRKVKNLIPPSNFAVQLIQPEQPLMFTTADEQTALTAITGSDKTLVRATFDWAHPHNGNYQFAERAQLFYRETPPAAIQGEVLNVYQLPDNQVRVQVTNYMVLSTSPSQNVEPLIPSGQESKYIGSLFATGNTGYVITAINNATSPYPEFTLEQIKQTSSSDPLNTNQFTTLVTWLQPSVGDRFTVVENLAVDANWSTHLARTVYLEKFSTNSRITLEATGTANNGTYRIEQVTNAGANTNIVVTEDLQSNTVAGNIRYDRVFRLRAIDTTLHTFVISGNVAAEFTGITTAHLFGSAYVNDGDYTITFATYTFPETTVTYTGTIPDTDSLFGYLSISKTATITGINKSTHTVTVSGNLAAIIIPPYIEQRVNYDSTITKLWYGGIYQPATVTAINDPVTGLPFGAYDVTFNSYTLPRHIDPSVDWYKGVFRSLDDATTPSFKQLEVWEIKKDSMGVPLSPLQLVVYDASYLGDTNHIHTGTSVYANFHPGYRVYLTAEFNGSGNNDSTHQFNTVTMLPATGDGSKVTFMGIRSLDRVKEPPTFTLTEYDSYIAPLVPVLAQEIVAPVAPKDLTGPLFATRPDFYRKSTYTVDIKLNTDDGRKPYGVLVYRGSETKVLDVLYKQDTLDLIMPVIKQLKVSDTAAYYTMIHDLVNVNVDGSGNFVATTNSLSFSFPLPDNDTYTIPDRNPAVIVHPFSTSTPILGTQVDIVKQAILGSFLSLTEQPVIYKYVKGGLTASPKKPVFRNANGDIVVPVLPENPLYNPEVYDPHPMAVKFAMTGTTTYLPSDAGYSTASDYYVRFTDFTLDGASREFYFYYACEISNQLVIGPNSPVKAPVIMVNSAPAEPPAIREVISVLADPANGINTAVQFKLAPYNETEGITQFWIYRAYNAPDASNIRTMKLARKINVGDPVTDDFSDLLIPPYGETLFYRIVAVRRIQNELLAAEDILSLPSNTALTNVVDILNPEPPALRSHNGTTTSTELNEVVLSWNPTCYNGTYRLQKLNSSGNWVEIYSTKVKDTPMQYPPLDTPPDFTTYPETDHLQRQDADGNPLYYRYRVEVENSSGLLNLTENELTLAKGASDIQELPSFLDYADNNGHSLAVLESADITAGASYPDQMHFTLLNMDLPAGHSSFAGVDITVTDSNGGSATKTISTYPGDVYFYNNDGPGLDLDTPNLDYTVTTRFYTDLAPQGAVQVFNINYLAGPCYDLTQLTDLVSLDDDTHTISPLASGNVNDGVAYPTQFIITDISDVFTATGQHFSSMDVTVTDSNGNSDTQTILSSGGAVTFNNGDGPSPGIDLLSPNLSYEIRVNLYTTACGAGAEAVYNINYTYTPCDDLAGLAGIAKYTDGNTFVIDPIADTTVTSHTNPNGSIAIKDEVSLSLPAGHTFDHLDVIIEDDNGGAYLQTTMLAGDTLTFTDGLGGLDMYTTHRTYFVTVILYTNLCTRGTSYAFTIAY